MTGPSYYPDETEQAFPAPPRTVDDDEGRTIELRAFDGDDADCEALREMYEAFDPADRAQGIPPSRPSKLRDWLERILDAECLNVFAWHDDEIVGHATLVPQEDPDSPHELAIFIIQSHQGAGIGTALMQAILGYGAAREVDQVWLTVERWNRPAVALYKKLGFEVTDAESFELEMAIQLTPSAVQTDNTG